MTRFRYIFLFLGLLACSHEAKREKSYVQEVWKKRKGDPNLPL